jgi:spore germination cell wall hydrolase CwlJ-like protein
MCLHLCRTLAALALTVLTGAAFADVTVSQSNAPTTLIRVQFASLLGAEHATVNAMPEARLAALARGPQAKAPQKGQTMLAYTDAWLASLPAPTGDGQWDCLRRAIYFEARGEEIEGQFAVAEVILNRLDSAGFPKTICGVVKAAGNGSCAFSYICDGISDEMRDPEAADRAGRIARAMIDGAPRGLTNGATYFHARWSRPDWGHVVKTAAIGGHLFYRMAS